MAKRKLNKNNLLILIGISLLFIALVTTIVIFLLQNNANKQSSTTYVAYQEVEVKDNDIASDQSDKVTEGIQLWAEATLGLDDSYSTESKVAMRKQFYNSIFNQSQRDTIKSADDTFYDNASVTVSDVTVQITEAKEAVSDNKNIGQVKTDITVTGTKNEEAFTRSYNLTLLIDYSKDVVSVLQVREIQVIG